MTNPEYAKYGENWLRYGHHKLSEELKDDEERAERLKNEWPAKYYEFDWTPDEPETE